MIDQYAKCLILVIVAGWIMGARECAAATPFTPRHSDPVQEFWRWRAVFCRASSSWDVGCLRLGNHVNHLTFAEMPR